MSIRGLSSSGGGGADSIDALAASIRERLKSLPATPAAHCAMFAGLIDAQRPKSQRRGMPTRSSSGANFNSTHNNINRQKSGAGRFSAGAWQVAASAPEVADRVVYAERLFAVAGRLDRVDTRVRRSFVAALAESGHVADAVQQLGMLRHVSRPPLAPSEAALTTSEPAGLTRTSSSFPGTPYDGVLRESFEIVARSAWASLNIERERLDVRLLEGLNYDVGFRGNPHLRTNWMWPPARCNNVSRQLAAIVDGDEPASGWNPDLPGEAQHTPLPAFVADAAGALGVLAQWIVDDCAGEPVASPEVVRELAEGAAELGRLSFFFPELLELFIGLLVRIRAIPGHNGSFVVDGILDTCRARLEHLGTAVGRSSLPVQLLPGFKSTASEHFQKRGWTALATERIAPRIEHGALTKNTARRVFENAQELMQVWESTAGLSATKADKERVLCAFIAAHDAPLGRLRRRVRRFDSPNSAASLAQQFYDNPLSIDSVELRLRVAIAASRDNMFAAATALVVSAASELTHFNKEESKLWHTALEEIIDACIRAKLSEDGVAFVQRLGPEKFATEPLLRLVQLCFRERAYKDALVLLQSNNSARMLVQKLASPKLVQLISLFSPKGRAQMPLPGNATSEERVLFGDAVRLLGVILRELNARGDKIDSFSAKRSLLSLLVFTDHLQEAKSVLLDTLSDPPTDPEERASLYTRVQWLLSSTFGLALSRGPDKGALADMLQLATEANAAGLPSTGPLFMSDIARVLASHGNVRQALSLIDGIYEAKHYAPLHILRKIVRCCGANVQQQEMGEQGSHERRQYRESLLRTVLRMPPHLVDFQCAEALVFAWDELDGRADGAAAARIAAEWTARHMADSAPSLHANALSHLLTHCSSPNEVLRLFASVVVPQHRISASRRREREFPLITDVIRNEHTAVLFSRVAGVPPPPTALTARRMNMRELSSWFARAAIPTDKPLEEMSKTQLIELLTGPDAEAARRVLGAQNESLAKVGGLHPAVRDMWAKELELVLSGEIPDFDDEHSSEMPSDSENGDEAIGVGTVGDVFAALTSRQDDGVNSVPSGW